MAFLELRSGPRGQVFMLSKSIAKPLFLLPFSTFEHASEFLYPLKRIAKLVREMKSKRMSQISGRESSKFMEELAPREMMG